MGAFVLLLMSSLAGVVFTRSQDIGVVRGARILFFLAAKCPERERAKVDRHPDSITTQDRDVPTTRSRTSKHARCFRTLDVDAIDSLGKTVRTDLSSGRRGLLPVHLIRNCARSTFDEAENWNHARVRVLGLDDARVSWRRPALGEWITVDGSRCRGRHDRQRDHGR